MQTYLSAIFFKVYLHANALSSAPSSLLIQPFPNSRAGWDSINCMTLSAVSSVAIRSSKRRLATARGSAVSRAGSLSTIHATSTSRSPLPPSRLSRARSLLLVDTTTGNASGAKVVYILVLAVVVIVVAVVAAVVVRNQVLVTPGRLTDDDVRTSSSVSC